MRVLSFIPALFLAAASFVVAAPSPAPVPGADLSVRGTATVSDVVAIITNLTTQITVISGKFNETVTVNASIDADVVSTAITETANSITTTVASLKAVATVDLSVDLKPLITALSALLSEILTALYLLLAISFKLTGDALATLSTAVHVFLIATRDLLETLNIFFVAEVANTLGPVLATLQTAIQLVIVVVVAV